MFVTCGASVWVRHKMANRSVEVIRLRVTPNTTYLAAPAFMIEAL
jgi:hypothetical protein